MLLSFIFCFFNSIGNDTEIVWHKPIVNINFTIDTAILQDYKESMEFIQGSILNDLNESLQGVSFINFQEHSENWDFTLDFMISQRTDGWGNPELIVMIIEFRDRSKLINEWFWFEKVFEQSNPTAITFQNEISKLIVNRNNLDSMIYYFWGNISLCKWDSICWHKDSPLCILPFTQNQTTIGKKSLFEIRIKNPSDSIIDKFDLVALSNLDLIAKIKQYDCEESKACGLRTSTAGKVKIYKNNEFDDINLFIKKFKHCNPVDTNLTNKGIIIPDPCDQCPIY